MTDVSTPGASARLYSQTPFDERGNFHYEGDLYRPGDNLTTLATRIAGHLKTKFPDIRFAIKTEKLARGRKIIVGILDAPADLTKRDAQNDLLVSIRDQIERFGFTRSNIYQDFHNCSFYCEARISQSYWAALAARRGPKNPVEARISLAAFKKQVRLGDSLKLLDAPTGHRAIGTTRAIIQVRSGDLILEGGSYLSFPRACAFACDGKLVRISNGSEYDPDSHLLYEWRCRDAA